MKHLLLIFGLVLGTQESIAKSRKYKDDLEPLEWSSKYTVSATRTSLTSGMIEKYEIWRTKRSSRIDYNNGYVKSFVKPVPKKIRSYEYEVHPEFSEYEETTYVCTYKYKYAEPGNILPDLDVDYESEGYEVMDDKEAVKFTYNYTDDSTDERRTLWASYSEDKSTWIPVRYEVYVFNTWLGSKEKHELWDYYGYDEEFSSYTIFDVSEYDCTESEDDDDDETKHLKFIDPENDEHVDNLFNKFKEHHNRNYADTKEHALKRSIFKNTMRRVKENNRRNTGFKLTINQFADKSPEEMKQHMGLLRRPEGKTGTIQFPYTEHHIKDIAETLPKEYDARIEGLVTPVKDQDECGSCWTFGTTAAVEGALARKNGGKLMILSNQALIDCAWPFGAQGCNGGTDDAAYQWMTKYGLPLQDEYGPYLNKDGLCNIENMTTTFPIQGYTDVTPLNADALKVALINHGPLSVSVQVNTQFNAYASGIFYDITCDGSPDNLNHEVTLVGYGERYGEDFWIIKNSWGPNWGVNGYMYISAKDNNCGVTTEPTYVVF